MKTNEQKLESGIRREVITGIYGQLCGRMYVFSDEMGCYKGVCSEKEVGKYLLQLARKLTGSKNFTVE